MNKITGTIILGLIAIVFGTDAVLATQDHMTISEWFYNFLHNDPLTGFAIIIGFCATLIAHFWWFRPLKDDLSDNNKQNN